MGPISSMDQFAAAGVISGGSRGAGHIVITEPSDALAVESTDRKRL